MALLVGRHINKIDKKGRVSVPKPFRAQFSGLSFQGLYAYPLFKQPAIEACDETFMERIAESLDDLDMFSDEQDDLASVVLESSHALAFDPEGRVVLPPELLEHAGISDKALFVGRGKRMQIWHPEAYQARHREAFDRAKARGATLSLRRPTGDGSGGG